MPFANRSDVSHLLARQKARGQRTTETARKAQDHRKNGRQNTRPSSNRRSNTWLGVDLMAKHLSGDVRDHASGSASLRHAAHGRTINPSLEIGLCHPHLTTGAREGTMYGAPSAAEEAEGAMAAATSS